MVEVHGDPGSVAQVQKTPCTDILLIQLNSLFKFCASFYYLFVCEELKLYSTRALITTLLHIWRDNARTNCGHLLIDLYDSWVIKSDISRSFQTTNKALSSWKATSVINFTNENQTTYLMMFLQFSQRCLLCINLSFAKLAAYGQLRCPSIIDLPRNGGSQS